MPKLNVQQNNQNVIQAFKNALAIGNLKGIIASDGSHNFSTAGSNRNLLDNPWFTVRQRGDGPFSGANTEAVDRWRTTSNSTMTGTTDGITLTTTVRTWGMQQRVAKDFLVVGKTYTISAMEQDGTITSATFTWTGSGMSKYVTGANVGFEISASNANYNQIYFTTNYVGSVYLRAVKLELGSISTLANDAPPNYAEELEKCKYYCRVIEGNTYTVIGQAVASTSVRFPMQFAMRATPSISVIGSIQVNGNGGLLTVSSITVNGWGATCVELNCGVSGATSHTPYLLLPASGAKIILSADL